MASLPPHQQALLRKEYATGKYTQRQLAERFGVSQPYVSRNIDRRPGRVISKPLARVLPNGRKIYTRFCPKGHDKEIVGYNVNGACRRCRSDRSNRRQHRRRALLNAYKLRKGCTLCGYNTCVSALHFHHRDPTLKRFVVGKRGSKYSWKRTLEELKKCIVLCANCHAEEHERMTRGRLA